MATFVWTRSLVSQLTYVAWRRKPLMLLILALELKRWRLGEFHLEETLVLFHLSNEMETNKKIKVNLTEPCSK